MPKLVVELYEWPRVRPGENFTMRFNIRNEDSVDFKGGRLFVLSDAFFQPSSDKIPPVKGFGPEKSFSVEVHVNTIPIRSIPSVVNCEIGEYINPGRDESTRKIQTFPYRLRMAFFTKGLVDETVPSSDINVLFFGLAGATKSSFGNAIATLLSGNDRIMVPFSVGGNARHATLNLVRHKLDQYYPGVKVNIWDTWGLTPETYQGNELEMILEGKLPDGWEMKDSIEQNAAALADFIRDKAARKIHSIIFFIPQAALSDPNMEKLRRTIAVFFTQLVHFGINPLILVTKVDEVNTAVRGNPCGEYKDLEQLREKAAKLLNVGPNNIYYNINYFRELEKTFEIDRMTFQILNEAVHRGKDVQQKTNASNSATSASYVSGSKVWKH